MKRIYGLTAACLAMAIAIGASVHAQAKDDSQVSKLAHEGYWLKEQEAAYKAAMAMLDKPAPALGLTAWNGKAVTPANAKGKIILVDFWATWCGPCIGQIPHANEMARKYADKGVVVMGACCARGANTMAKTAKEHGMEYPTGKLSDKATNDWKIRFWPTYAVIDRTGKLRAVGLQPDYVEKVLDALIEEQPAAAEKK
ncbi:MAG TPA: TlpA disulfide reductase family protein [Tepidisphaeraceae bacterium]|nr:TlpA disulfide reductase family protein [Tepidisphaeraceae bacterium]